MRVDDWYEDIDDALGETVDEMFGRIKQAKVVSLDHYRKISKEYKSWKPLSLEDYTFQLKATQEQKINKRCQEARNAYNERILKEAEEPTNKDKV